MVPPSLLSVSPAHARHTRWWCFAIALLFAAWALRTVGANNIVDTDAARHAMNGAFLHDLIASGNLMHPVEFGRTYYARMPALSLPYHPPLFPLIEAVFFSVLGVNVLAARLAIAIAVAVSAILFFQLIVTTHRSHLVAALSTVTFLSLPVPLWLASDVMLEFPALTFTLLAFRCLCGVETEYPLKRALVFAVLAGAAVWTKQQTVFLGAVPFFYIALIGQWRLFLQRSIWISSAVFMVLVAGLAALSLSFKGVGVNQAAPPEGTIHVLLRNAKYYILHYPDAVGPAGVVLLIAFAGALAGRLLERRQIAIYIAWAGSSLLVLLLIGPFSVRYLFFVYPALFVLGYASLIRLTGKWPAGRRTTIAVCVGLLALARNLESSSSVFLRGPDEAARLLTAAAPRRILYCGGTDGSFIFNYRALDTASKTTIIAGAKLPASVFTPAGLNHFAHRYGVQYIVLEVTPPLMENRHWSALMKAPPRSMLLERDIPLTSSDRRWNGSLRIYRFTNPSVSPDNDLTVTMNMIGGSMDVKLATQQ
jgi:hypothetical protein